MKCGAAAGEVDDSSTVINVQTVGEGQGRALNLTCDGSGNAAVGPNNKEAQVGIGNVEITISAEAQPQWSPTYVL